MAEASPNHPHGGPVNVIECEACGFRHIDPLLSDEELKQFYNTEF